MTRPTMTREDYKAMLASCLEKGCKKGNHMLEKIFESGSDMESIVVRWCSTCGSITVDMDFDGRTRPGAMKSPLITKALN